ncbi:MAG: hypothetical protein BWZ02_00836 [Lentisphaerae bacterium ADurb.BinA184]|nr:MAG: hypothetical protein BWZ02_00836 [Lentisphaerae bacterium ADurb.BinA184]
MPRSTSLRQGRRSFVVTRMRIARIAPAPAAESSSALFPGSTVTLPAFFVWPGQAGFGSVPAALQAAAARPRAASSSAVRGRRKLGTVQSLGKRR